MRNTFDRLHVVFIVVLALATVAIAVLCTTILDRSYEHVKKIEQTDLSDKSGDLSMAIVHNAEDAKLVLGRQSDPRYEERFSDETVSVKQLRELANRPSLFRLKFLRCDFEPNAFQELESLKLLSLVFSDCMVNKKMIDSVTRMRNLKYLDLFRCDLADDALDDLGQSKLEMLKLRKSGPDGNHGHLTVRQVVGLAKLPNLVNLDLSKTHFDEGIFDHLVSVNCKVFNVSHSNITANDLDTIKKMPRLQFLILERVPNISCKDLMRFDGSKTPRQVRVDGPLLNCGFSGELQKKFDRSLYQVPVDLLFQNM